MAAFRLKLTGLSTFGPMGRIYTINDNGMNRILNAGRASYGQVAVGSSAPDVMRDMTNTETVYKMFDGFVNGWLNNAFVNTRDVVKATAASSVTLDSAAVQDDNV